jgi:hypothetical protein
MERQEIPSERGPRVFGLIPIGAKLQLKLVERSGRLALELDRVERRIFRITLRNRHVHLLIDGCICWLERGANRAN